MPKNTKKRDGADRPATRTKPMFQFLPKLGFDYNFINKGPGKRRILVAHESDAVMYLLAYHHDKDGQKLTKGKTDAHLAELFTAAKQNVGLLQSMEVDAYMAACLAAVKWATPSNGAESYDGPKNLAGDVAYRLMIKLMEGRETYLDKASPEMVQRDNKYAGPTAHAIDGFTTAILANEIMWGRHDLQAIFSGSAATQVEVSEEEEDEAGSDESDAVDRAEEEFLNNMDFRTGWAVTHHSLWGKVLALDLIETEEYKTLYGLDVAQVWAVSNHPAYKKMSVIELIGTPEYRDLARRRFEWVASDTDLPFEEYHGEEADEDMEGAMDGLEIEDSGDRMAEEEETGMQVD